LQHREKQRLRDIEETMQRHFNYVAPLRSPHAGHRGVVMHACVIDQHLDRACLENGCELAFNRRRIGHVETGNARAAAGLADFFRDPFRSGSLPVGVNDHRKPVLR
jgi:hypothetical protein